MNEVWLRSRKSGSKRVREIQGVLAMRGVESETATETKTERVSAFPVETSGKGSQPRVWRASDVKPLPYRMVLATWPDEWRERWGRLANELEDAGLSWRDAEGRAFVEIWNQWRVAADVERN